MITKELLSEVTNIEILTIESFCPKNEICWTYDNAIKVGEYTVVSADGGRGNINIYELAHRCKEWAYKDNYMIQSYPYNGRWRADLLRSLDVDEVFKANSEVEAIFKACEWILAKEKMKETE